MIARVRAMHALTARERAMLGGIALLTLLAALGRHAGLPDLLAFGLAALALAGLACSARSS